MRTMALATRAILCGAMSVGLATATACSSGDATSEAQAVGTVKIPLLATLGANTYRLEAVFAISGAQGVTNLATNGDEPVLSTTLPAGAYSALLESFTLFKNDGNGTFRAVPATVVSDTQPFTIFPETTTAISFQFETLSEVVSVGSGELSITFGVSEVPIAVDRDSRTVRSARFFLDFSNLLAANPEEVDVLQWAGGSNLVESFAQDTCTSGVVEHFGNSWVPPDPTSGGQVLVGSGTTGTWEQEGASIVIRSKSSGCPESRSVPLETRYSFREGLGADTIEVERRFDFSTTALTRPFRPFMPRLTVAFDRVIHPDAAGTTLLTDNVFDCPYGCQLTNWDGSWFAYYASTGPHAGQGMIVRREPSAIPANLWIDNDAGITDTNASGVLLLPPAGDFPAQVTEKELLCFFDADTWPSTDQASLALPPGCTLHPVTSECEPNPCTHGAACLPLSTGHACDCPSGTFGTNCELGFVAIADGQSFSCGLAADGQVSCWGYDGFRSAEPPSDPFRAITAGFGYACGIRHDGTLVCWGDQPTPNGEPFQVPSGTFVALSGSSQYFCAIRSDATLACAGDDAYGKTTPPSGEFGAISTGFGHACGLRTDGTLDCWGSNAERESEPPSGQFKAVASGGAFSCAIDAGDALVCWGRNILASGASPAGTFAALAAGNQFLCALTTDGGITCWDADPTFDLTPPSGTFGSISASAVHACALGTDGVVACWGRQQISPPGRAFETFAEGCGTRGDHTFGCVDDLATGAFTALTRGANYACAVTADETLTCFETAPGQLNNQHGQATPPTGAFTAVAAGSYFTCGIRTDQSLACWGIDDGGQSTPPDGTFLSLSAAANHACAVRSDHQLVCWGSNSYLESETPPGEFQAVSCGNGHSCALDLAGHVACWGSNDFGQTESPSGVFSALASGTNGSCAIGAEDGALTCWGAAPESLMRPPPGAFEAVSFMGSTACALRRDRTVACWGYDVRSLPPTESSACDGQTCSGAGTCRPRFFGADCACGDGYVQPFGDLLSCVFDECARSTPMCDHHVFCHNTLDGKVCGPCPPGYSGTGNTACVLSSPAP